MNLVLPDNQEFSNEQYEKIEKNFKLVDSDKDGFLNQQEARILHRAFGQNITEEELNNLMGGLPGKVDLETFIDFFKKNYRDPTSEETLIQAFQVFDVTDKGTIEVAKFREVIETLGEPLTEKDLSEIMGEIKLTDQGEINYVDFAKFLIAGPKGLRHSS